MRKEILYISWQGAMGHVTRDLAIAQEIRKQIPEAEISWMAPQFFIADRLERHKAGIKMEYDKTTPEKLAEVVLANIGKEATWPAVPAEGARNAAQLISQFLQIGKNTQRI